MTLRYWMEFLGEGGDTENLGFGSCFVSDDFVQILELGIRGRSVVFLF